MINVGELISDPDFAQIYRVHRFSGVWSAGMFVESEEVLDFLGPVQPSSAKEIQQVPEGDRSTAMMTFYSTDEIFVTRRADPNEGFGQGTSDQIEWRGDRYRIVNVNQFGDYGYYQAIGTYMEGY